MWLHLDDTAKTLFTNKKNIIRVHKQQMRCCGTGLSNEELLIVRSSARVAHHWPLPPAHGNARRTCTTCRQALKSYTTKTYSLSFRTPQIFFRFFTFHNRTHIGEAVNKHALRSSTGKQLLKYKKRKCNCLQEL